MPVVRVPINIVWTGKGSPGVNVFHIRTTDTLAGAGEVELQNGLDALHAFYTDLARSDWGGGGMGIFSGGTSFTLGDPVDVETQEVWPGTWVQVDSSAAVSYAPAPVALVVGWQTSIAARRGRGRTFLGPLGTHVLQTDGTPLDPAVQHVRDAAADLVTASQGPAGWSLAVWGLQSQQTWPLPEGTKPSSLPHVARDVVSSRVRDTYAVLRSRRD